MTHYMVTVRLPEELDDEFLSLIPRQRAHINGLMGKGVVVSYALAFDRSRLWITMLGESAGEIEAVVDEFPLRKFMSVDITPLMFLEGMPHKLLAVSLN